MRWGYNHASKIDSNSRNKCSPPDLRVVQRSPGGTLGYRAHALAACGFPHLRICPAELNPGTLRSPLACQKLFQGRPNVCGRRQRHISMPGHQMNMSMLYRLIRLCSAVHHNAETLRLPFLDQEFSQFANEFKASGIFNRRQIEDGWGVVAANDQGMTWRNGPRVQNGECMVVARQLRLEVMTKRTPRSLHYCLPRPGVGRDNLALCPELDHNELRPCRIQREK